MGSPRVVAAALVGAAVALAEHGYRFARVADSSRWSGHPPAAGMYHGRYLEDWNRGVRGDLDVGTFGDLSGQRLMYFPWDLGAYGTDARDYPVARAVRAFGSYPIELFDR